MPAKSSGSGGLFFAFGSDGCFMKRRLFYEAAAVL
jgi:hypothetical protein